MFGDKRADRAKPCHNCRRKRLRCDRAYPHCAKCVSRGIECLGYGQLFLWTGSVASRGKLAGEKSTAALCHNSATDETPKPGRALFGNLPGTYTRHLHGGAEGYPYRARHDQSTGSWVVPAQQGSMPHTLVDPLFQDMRYSHRKYLNYFSSRVCLDLISDDAPGRNPFRNLVPLTQAHPLLQEVIVAVAASHMHSQSRFMLSPGPWASNNLSSPFLRDALLAKQGALRMMSTALDSVNCVSSDVTLAACLFLLNLEMLESGKKSWRPHLEGAGRIMSLMHRAPVASDTLRDYLMSDCLVEARHYVLSSVFSPAFPDIESYFPMGEAMSIIRKATNSFMCCPPEVLEIIIEASKLSHSAEGITGTDYAEIVDAAGELLHRAYRVDTLSWALESQGTTVPTDSNGLRLGNASRFRTGSAHRLAACLYILQAVPALQHIVEEGLIDIITDDLRHYLESIVPPDPNFKATTWPTFVFGATAESPDTRAWVIERLRQVIAVYPWGFLNTAMEGLGLIWQQRDMGRGGANGSWLHILRNGHHDFLMV